MSCKLVNCVHRHCVFTIPEELRIYFLNDRSLLNCLFHSVRDVVLRMFHKQNKAELFGRNCEGNGNQSVCKDAKQYDYQHHLQR